MKEKSQKVDSWLETKLLNQEHGIIFDDEDLSSFGIIQDFLEANEHPFKTPVIYYKAFAQESAAEFFNILHEELSSKLGNHKLRSDLTLPETIANAGLKMIVIDQSYLHPFETIKPLLKLSTENKISLILVGAKDKMKSSQVFNHPSISQWDQFWVNTLDLTQHDNLSMSC